MNRFFTSQSVITNTSQGKCCFCSTLGTMFTWNWVQDEDEMVGAGPGSVVGQPWRVRLHDFGRSINRKNRSTSNHHYHRCQSVKDEPLVSLWLHIHIASVATSRHALAWEHRRALESYGRTLKLAGHAKDVKLQEITQDQLVCLQCVKLFWVFVSELASNSQSTSRTFGDSSQNSRQPNSPKRLSGRFEKMMFNWSRSDLSMCKLLESRLCTITRLFCKRKVEKGMKDGSRFTYSSINNYGLV